MSPPKNKVCVLRYLVVNTANKANKWTVQTAKNYKRTHLNEITSLALSTIFLHHSLCLFCYFRFEIGDTTSHSEFQLLYWIFLYCVAILGEVISVFREFALNCAPYSSFGRICFIDGMRRFVRQWIFYYFVEFFGVIFFFMNSAFKSFFKKIL